MSRITITLSNELIDELMSVIEAKSKTEAVVKAIKNEIKHIKKEKIKNMAGTIEFTDADTLRHGDERLG
jgi:metal-responsive CopG/Arc/MetJ family transcriptional regulator